MTIDNGFGMLGKSQSMIGSNKPASRDTFFRIAEASNRKDMELAQQDARIAELESTVTDLIGVIRALVSLAQPISLPTFLHVQQAVAKAQRAKDAA